MRRKNISGIARGMRAAMLGLIAVGLSVAPASAQVRTVDPNTAIDADLAPQPGASAAPTDPGVVAADQTGNDGATVPAAPATGTADATTAGGNGQLAQQADPATNYKKDDLIGAAEGVFGKGAEGLAGIIEKILKDQGEPNAYIAGREASGALVVGLRYGSGTLHHKIEGARDIYWTGPSVGFDVGGNASKTFVLVYNLYDTQEIYHRFPAGEGAAYLVGGFNASYLRWGHVVLIPIRMGVGYRLGINAGYMKFTEKRNWLPF